MSETWYDKRDLRTDNCEGVHASYKDVVIQVCVNEDLSEYRVQLITFLSISQLARWCRNIIFTGTSSKCLLVQSNISFDEFLTSEVTRIDPFCKFSIDSSLLSKPSIVLNIGNPIFETESDFVVINASGWLSVCSFNKKADILISEKHNPIISVCFAACLANAELFRYAIGMKSRPYVKWYSLWLNEIMEYTPTIENYGPEIPFINLGRIHLVGCGAIGSSFAFLFPYAHCKAEFVLIDPDKIEDHNTSSSMLFGYSDAIANREKALVSQDYLLSNGNTAMPFIDDYKNFQYDYSENKPNTADIILCFANENNIWSTIQNLYPPVCFHATTSKSWGINIGRHIPLKENCLMCTFEDFVKTEFKPVCAEVSIPDQSPITEESHTAILPFLAPAAAIVTLSEVIKMGIKKIEHNNTVIFNMSGSNGNFVNDYQAFGSCFICKDQKELYPQFGKFSKYWALSIANI